MDISTLNEYSIRTDKAILAFQIKHGVKLSLDDVYNYDEFRIDLADYAPNLTFNARHPSTKSRRTMS